jgi:DUF4097 and DUF4098 domain-containing protein YvlB
MTLRFLALGALALAGAAAAATPVDQTRPLDADGQVSIDNVKGSIVVRTWDRPEVKITGSLGEGVTELRVEGDARDLQIEVRYPEQRGLFNWGSNGTGPSDLQVTVPARAAVVVDSVSANVDVSGVGGRRLSVDSVSGNVLVRASRAGEASFDSVSGDLDLEVESADTRADTVSGDLTLRGRLTGEVSLDTVSGDARLQAGPLSELSLSSVSGDADLRTALATGGSIRADSVSGRLSLTLPKAVSARLRVETFSGDILSPVGEVQTEEYGPGKRLDARLGSGSGDIRLESFSGDVRLTFE